MGSTKHKTLLFGSKRCRHKLSAKTKQNVSSRGFEMFKLALMAQIFYTTGRVGEGSEIFFYFPSTTYQTNAYNMRGEFSGEQTGQPRHIEA
jgi:hypothetical protein